jgi:hypothetical protein
MSQEEHRYQQKQGTRDSWNLRKAWGKDWGKVRGEDGDLK